MSIPSEILATVLCAIAVATSYYGFGLPNHPYQIALGVLMMLLCYHRQWLPRPKRPLDFLLAALNVTVLSMQWKLFIGGGWRAPLDWMQYPSIQWLPKFQMQWHDLPGAGWQVDTTRVQCFLLIFTVLGAWLKFQPFASLTALALCLISIPAYVDLRWDWVFPAVVCAMVSFYVQANAPARSTRRPA